MFFHIYFVTIYPYHFNIISMEYQCNIRTRFIRSHCSGKTSVTIDALFLLEHAASHHATGETEKTQSYGWWWIVVLQSSSTVRTVVTEIITQYISPPPLSLSKSLTRRGSGTHLYICPCTSHTSRTSRRPGPWPDNNSERVKLASLLTLSSSVHSHLAEILLQYRHLLQHWK